MKYKNLQTLSETGFRRLTGIHRKTFETMVQALTKAEQVKKAKGGRPSKLCIEDKLLMTLEYLREYRTYLHISANYGLSESNTFETIRWVEDTLVKSGVFKLPGRKALLKSDYQFEVVLIDATETPIERPKKNNANSTQARKKGIR